MHIELYTYLAANTIRLLIPYRNITNICHKLIIYSDWTHLININFVKYTEMLDISSCVLCRNNVYSWERAQHYMHGAA